jgi:endonuclease YncB( thermonuclease family)
MCCLVACNRAEEGLIGRVVKVSDGDTITVLDSSKTQHKIRLQGIDAPEKSQAYGDAAQRYLAGLVAGQEVRVAWSKRDKYDRILGTVYVKGEEVNLAMLRAGYAWHYKKFDSTPAYAQAESIARAARRGLWAGLDPIPPEQFRHGRARSPSAPPSTSSARTEYRAGRTLPVSARTPAPVNATWPDTGYWLSTNSNKRHNRNCENYRKTHGYPCQKNEGERCGKCGG